MRIYSKIEKIIKNSKDRNKKRKMKENLCRIIKK